ncbi:MAG TPA: rod shape-determining protein MreC [Acidimicrobiales bacterium]|nr:rod shape-determining protein MreC [Acidimicrobiales bacterium]
MTRHTSQRLTLVMLVLASITFITLDYRGDAKSTITSVRNGARDALAPVQRVISDLLRPVGDFFAGSVNYGHIQAQNEALQKEIGEMELKLAQSGASEQQLQQLLAQENLPFVENIPTVLAQVIVGPTSNFQLTIEIDRGTAQGVGVGMPVVAGPGLAGTITSAGADTATAQLITDANASIGVRFGNDEIAVVNGEGASAPLSLAFVQSGESAKTGDEVYTSGLAGAAYPADIPIGTVSSVQSTKGTYTQVVTVKPAVDFSHLDYVTVLQWLPPA